MMPLDEYLSFSTRLILSVILILGAMFVVLLIWDYEPNATKGVQAKTWIVESNVFPSDTPDEDVYRDLMKFIISTGAIVRREISNAKLNDSVYEEGVGKKQFVVTVIQY
jgi:hypothetical protein